MKCSAWSPFPTPPGQTVDFLTINHLFFSLHKRAKLSLLLLTCVFVFKHNFIFKNWAINFPRGTQGGWARGDGLGQQCLSAGGGNAGSRTPGRVEQHLCSRQLGWCIVGIGARPDLCAANFRSTISDRREGEGSLGDSVVFLWLTRESAFCRCH